MDRYIGLDVHATSCTAAIVDLQGKKLGHHVIETNGEALVQFFKMQAGTVHLCIEEGTQAGWLVEILTPHVAELAVIRERSRGQKSDKIDGFGLANKLRTGAIETRVFKHVGPYGSLRQLVKAHAGLVEDSVRVQNRLKALYRARGLKAQGKRVYSLAERSSWLETLPASSRQPARLLLDQYDQLCLVRDEAEKQLVAESHRHSITKTLETCPGLGSIRVARLVATVISPQRFRRRSKFWAYCGLAVVLRTSSDYRQRQDGGWDKVKVDKTRGLNRNHNRMLKNVFKGAATTVVILGRQSPLGRDYQRLLEGGTKPNLAQLTLARKIAATALAMWKNKEVYDPDKYARVDS